MPKERRRLDAVLVERGLAPSRERAKELIAGGYVTVDGRPASKPSQTVGEKAELCCDSRTLRYVGRGGYKLEKALTLYDLPLAGAVAMDVGASTGGFTDCMLQNGAGTVYAIDVGHGQLHESLRANPRVRNLEGIDIRNTERIREFIGESSVLFCSIDVSFISVKSIFPSILPFLQDGAFLVCLIKPQFEAGRQAIGKNGVVKDRRAHERVLSEMGALFSTHHCRLHRLDYSPIPGGEGNIEYLAILEYRPQEGCPPAMTAAEAASAVAAAPAALRGRGAR